MPHNPIIIELSEREANNLIEGLQHGEYYRLRSNGILIEFRKPIKDSELPKYEWPKYEFSKTLTWPTED